MFSKSLLFSFAMAGIVFNQTIFAAEENGSSVDKLIADYNNNAILASTLVDTAGQYVWDRKYEDAKKLYHAVIEIHPNNPYVKKSHIGLTRLNALTLIEEKKYSLAQQQVNLMSVDFNGAPDLAVALFHIGKEFVWQHRFSEATETFYILLKQPLNDSFSQEARLWFARAQVCSLIEQAKDEEIIASIDKMLRDFDGHAGLAEAIYWLSKEYEWKKSASDNRNGWYDAPNSVFQRLVQNFGNTSFGHDAGWDQKRLQHRMEIFKLMKDADQNTIDIEIEKMVADLSSRTELAGELLWIAWGYEEQLIKDVQANQLYQRIIAEYPGSDEVKDAYYCSGVYYSKTKDYTKAIEMYKKLVADWPDYRLAWNAWFMIGRHYQRLAENGNIPKIAADVETKAAYLQIVSSFPDCPVNEIAKCWLKSHKED